MAPRHRHTFCLARHVVQNMRELKTEVAVIVRIAVVLASLVPQNMPGAGSLRVANVLYNTASKDGLTIGMIGRGMAMEPLIGASQPQYDARKFTWLGSR